jgi:hypothetical protein
MKKPSVSQNGRKYSALIFVTILSTAVFLVMSAFPIFVEKLSGNNYVALLGIVYSGYFGANVWQKRNENRFGSCSGTESDGNEESQVK